MKYIIIIIQHIAHPIYYNIYIFFNNNIFFYCNKFIATKIIVAVIYRNKTICCNKFPK